MSLMGSLLYHLRSFIGIFMQEFISINVIHISHHFRKEEKYWLSVCSHVSKKNQTNFRKRSNSMAPQLTQDTLKLAVGSQLDSFSRLLSP